MNVYNWNLNYSEQELEQFIRQQMSKEDIRHISTARTLSENFIIKFDKILTYSSNELMWQWVSQNQNLSEEFVRNFKDKINWKYLRYNYESKFSDKFCEEFDSEIKYNHQWYWNNTLHRTLGPAIDEPGYSKEFWYRGEHLKNIHSMEQYKHWLNLRAFA